MATDIDGENLNLPEKKNSGMKPFVYETRGQKWLEEMQQKAAAYNAAISVTGELQVMRACLQKILDAVEGDEVLTEMANGVQVDMCDATKFKLIQGLGSIVMKLSFVEHRMGMDKYVLMHDVYRYSDEIWRIINEEFSPDIKQQDRLKNKLANAARMKTVDVRNIKED